MVVVLIRSAVASHDAADPAIAAAHFEARLTFEADCSDVAADLAAGVADFIVVDCRSPQAYMRGHVPGAINLPHRRITAETVERRLPPDRLLITYCNGPHCNASTRGALRLAQLGRRVKEMPGGMVGWNAEDLPVEVAERRPVTAGDAGAASAVW
jgi:rhodanese-related sulfurtransferase